MIYLVQYFRPIGVLVNTDNENQIYPRVTIVFSSWVNPIKRGGMDGVFQGLAGLLRGISRGRSPREIPNIPTLLLGFTFYLK